MKQPKLQLTDEQKQELRAIVKASVRGMLNDREDLLNKDLVMRRIWEEMLKAPQWSIVENGKKPEDAPDEIWSMTPIVKKP
ncbi:MAG TPA: hypothetical protein VGH38_04810 [Bryobacteraceae bacterium]